MLQFKPDTDVALLNAMIHTIIDEDLVNETFVDDRTSGFEALKENAKNFSPEKMAPICGIPAETIREVARAFATSKGSMILWGMGISQHIHGTDNARCLIALSLMTGQVGRPGTGLHPLRGQNNVQGASDSGLIPMMYPDYQRVATPEAQQRFEKLWGATLDPKPGLTVVEIMNAAYDGQDPRHVHHGREPGDVRPGRRPCARGDGEARAPGGAGHLPHRDRLSRRRGAAGHRLAGEGRHGDQHRPHGAARPQGAASRRARRSEDLWIIVELAKRLGLDWNYAHPKEVFNEMRTAAWTRSRGITWERLERDSSVTYPCENEGDPGQPVVFTDAFPDAHRARQVRPGRPDPGRRAARTREYPMVLITGRQLEHWHTGAMTRRAGVLDAIEPEPTASLHPLDLDAIGAKPGDVVTVESRRGKISLYARADDGTPRGAVFIPFCFYEAAANLLTNPALDPFGKIPEFKYCAVKVTRGGELTPRSSYGGGQALARAGRR